MIKQIKKYFTFMSGRPKTDKITECVKIVPFTLQWIVAIWLIYECTKYQNIFYGIMAIVFGWQSGWGMSIERFMNKELKDAESEEG